MSDVFELKRYGADGRGTPVTPEERRALANSLVRCHCGSGRKRGWWKPCCAVCERSTYPRKPTSEEARRELALAAIWGRPWGTLQ
jgi:hypothetical protein